LLLLLLFRLQQPKGEGIETRTSKAGSSRQEIPLLVQMHHRAIGKWARLAAEEETVSAVLNSTRQLRLWGQLTAEINEGGNQQQPNERRGEKERERCVRERADNRQAEPVQANIVKCARSIHACSAGSPLFYSSRNNT